MLATTGVGRSTARRMLTGPKLPDPADHVDGRRLPLRRPQVALPRRRRQRPMPYHRVAAMSLHTTIATGLTRKPNTEALAQHN